MCTHVAVERRNPGFAGALEVRKCSGMPMCHVIEVESEFVEAGCSVLGFKKPERCPRLKSVKQFEFDVVPVTVTTNRTQAKRFLTALDNEGTDTSLSNTAATLRNEIGVSKFVVHTLLEAALARESGIVTARAPRPEPEQVTNADAHFDTGLTLGHAEGLSDGTSLILANTVAGCFMREGVPPTQESIRHLLDKYDTLFED